MYRNLLTLKDGVVYKFQMNANINKVKLVPLTGEQIQSLMQIIEICLFGYLLSLIE